MPWIVHTSRDARNVDFALSCLCFLPTWTSGCSRNRSRSLTPARPRTSSRRLPRRARWLTVVILGKMMRQQFPSTGAATLESIQPEVLSRQPRRLGKHQRLPWSFGTRQGRSPGIPACSTALGDRVPYLGGDVRGPQPVPSVRPRKRTDEPFRRRLQRGVGLAPRPRRRSPLLAGRPGPLHPGTSTSNSKRGERTIHFGNARFAELAPGPILEPPFPGHTLSPFVN